MNREQAIVVTGIPIMIFLVLILFVRGSLAKSDVFFSPQVHWVTLEPRKVGEGSVMVVEVRASDEYGITSVEADMGGIEKINLELEDGTIYDGLWRGFWKVHSTEVKNYTSKITVTNRLGSSVEVEEKWCDPPIVASSGELMLKVNVPKTAVYGNATAISGYVSYKNKPAKGAVVKIRIGEAAKVVRTDSLGKFYYAFTPVKSTLISVRASYLGYVTECTGAVKVVKPSPRPPKLVLNTMVSGQKVKLGEEFWIRGKVTYGGEPLITDVKIKINGKELTIPTDSDGKYFFKYRPSSPGKYTIVVQVTKKGEINAVAQSTTTIEVIKEEQPILSTTTTILSQPDSFDMPQAKPSYMAPLDSRIKEKLNGSEKVRVILKYSDKFVSKVLTATEIEKLRKNTQVEGIYLDDRVEVLSYLDIIHWNRSVEEFNLTGENTSICILDTGATGINYTKGYDFVNNDSVPEDNHGHGTAMAQIIKTIAPNTTLYVAKVLGDNGTGYESDVLKGLEWCINQTPDVISFSIGSGSYNGFCDSNPVAQLANQAFDQEIFVVAASGNDGNTSFKAPACGSKVFSVGATTYNDTIASFSSVNPTLDLFAPSESGTSYSAAQVSASSLLIFEKEKLTPKELKYRLRSTGLPILYTYNSTLSINISRIDLYNALTGNKTMEPYDYQEENTSYSNATKYFPLATITDCTDITSSGTYTLTQDITPSSSNFKSYCINISANNVVLDCQWHKIQGNDTEDYGIYIYRSSNQVTNITIRNCNVTDWDTANIYLERANNNTLENIISLDSPDRGIHLRGSHNNTLTNITANSNFAGFHLYSSNSNTITNSTANSNVGMIGGDGFYIEYSLNNSISNVIANSNGYIGVYLRYSNFTTIANSTANSNPQRGIHLYSSHNNTIINSTANSNNDGFFLDSSDSNTLTNITANSNDYGLFIYRDSDNNVVNSSIFQNNSKAGVYLYNYTSDYPEYNKIYNCLFNNSGTYGNFRIDTEIPNPNYFNTTKQEGTRIYSAGNYIGGNYYTNSTGNGFSDTCEDSDQDGFCDKVYDIYNDTWCEPSINCSSQVDYLPLSDEYQGNNITNCTTITSSGTYTLTQDILDSSTSYCINISANNVVLDCQWHKVDGDDKADYGIYIYRSSNQVTNITIKNCNVTDWGTANIYLERANNNTLENIISLDSPDYGIYLKGSHNNAIINCSINKNAVGIYIESSNETSIKNSTVNSNGKYGFYFFSSNFSTITNSTANLNSEGNGFYLRYSHNNIFANSTANSNSEGFHLASSHNNTITNSTANSNSKSGFSLSSSNFNTITHSTATSNAVGFYILNSHNNTFTNITATSNSDNGFFLYSSDSNTITHSTAKNNYYGVHIYRDSDNNVINSSVFQNNLKAGVYLDSYSSYYPEYNHIYNCLFNNSINIRIDSDISNPNYFNTTKQLGTRIYSAGNYIGGNYYTNSTGNGFSDTCRDSNADGFCDSPYDVEHGDTSCSDTNHCDYLPLSDEFITCGYIVTENLNLDHDITGCEGTILHVGASNIFIDCNNHYLQSSGSIGINNTGYSNVTIRNCRVNMTGVGSDFGIYFRNVENGTIHNNTVETADDYGIYLYLTNYTNVTENNIKVSDSYAIYASSCVHNLIFNNTLQSYTRTLSLGLTNYTIVNSNTISSTGNNALYVTTSSHNIIKLNNVTAYGNYGLYSVTSLNNTFINNTFKASQYAVFFDGDENVSVSGGSIQANSADYYLRSLYSNVSFTNTNFTVPREIYFYDSYSWFNYNNESSGGIWINSSSDKQSIIKRELVNINQTLLIWNETNVSGSGVSISYRISGLLPNTYYRVYNNSLEAHTLMTDSSGVLPEFSIFLGSGGEHEIKIEKLPCSVAMGFSTELLNGIRFGEVSPSNEIFSAIGNNGTGETNYSILIQISYCYPNTGNLWTKVNQSFLNSNGDSIPYSKYYFRYNLSDNTVPGNSLTPYSLGYQLVESNLMDGNQTFLKFFLNVTYGTLPGTYETHTYFKLNLTA